MKILKRPKGLAPWLRKVKCQKIHLIYRIFQAGLVRSFSSFNLHPCPRPLPQVTALN